MIRYILALLILSGISFGSSKFHFWRGDTLSASKVKQKWGDVELDLKKFREGDMKEKSSMAFQILKKKKKFIGISKAEVEEKFGDPDGYYFSEVFPAYMIQRAKKKGEDSWQIVFSVDTQRKVTDIFVHKNCCD